jgi:hypothetical protein
MRRNLFSSCTALRALRVLSWLPQLTANHFLLMRLMAFPSEAVSVVPAHVSIDHALAGRGDRYEHHFLAACRTTRENRWDAVRRYAYCRHVRTSLVPVCWGCPITTGGCKKSFGSGRGFFKLKLGHCEIQSRPQGVKTGQRQPVLAEIGHSNDQNRPLSNRPVG